jgi:hypothetical protein
MYYLFILTNYEIGTPANIDRVIELLDYLNSVWESVRNKRYIEDLTAAMLFEGF